MTNNSETVGSIEDLHWLIQNADAILDARGLETDPFRRLTSLRKAYGANRGRLLSELVELRNRAKRKFSCADKMFFTQTGLEQSTSERIATYKSQRFQSARHAVDLCCGIGVDALPLSRTVDQLTIVDRSPLMTEMAAANLAVQGARQTTRVTADVRKIGLAEFDYWHFDPDRRADGRRRSSTDMSEPPLSEFMRLPQLSEHGAVKLAPAADWSQWDRSGLELEWIGCHRECQQLVLWSGALARHPGKRTATWLGGAEHEAVTLIEGHPAPIPVYQGVPPFIYEPRPSVLAAQLESSLANQFGLSRMQTTVPFLASEDRVASDLFRRFKTVEGMPFRRKSLVAYLHHHGLTVTEVKKRGVDPIQPNRLQRELRGKKQGEPVVLILFPIDRSIFAVIAHRDD